MIELRKYQTDTIESARQEIRNGKKRIIIQASCGAGKTIIAAEIVSSALEKDKKVLFLVHYRELAYQALERFQQYGIGDFCGLIMAGEDSKLNLPIQIASVQTYQRRLNFDEPESNQWFHNADLIIYDEAHSSIAKTRKEILKMYIDNNKTILGLTATPCRSDGRGLGEIYEAIIPAIGIGTLTKQEYLVPCVYYGAKELPDLENIPIVAGDYNKKVLGERVDKVKLVGDIYDNWARLAIDRQTVIFATNVNHSKHIKELFQKRGVSCEHIDSHTPDEERRDIYDNFRDGNIQVLTNCAILGEGVDFPWVSCVVLAKPSKSYARFVQMAGRGLRPYPGKTECLILDHAGLVFRHGFLDDEVCWSLDGKEIAWKKTTRKKEKKILDCEICGTLFSGNRCTQCGHEIKNYGKRIETTDDDLHEIGKNKKKDKELTTEEKKMWYQMLKGEQRRLGKNEKWLLAKYKSRTGVWPRNMDGLMPLSANDDVKKWLTYERIKWIKGKQKMEQAA